MEKGVMLEPTHLNVYTSVRVNYSLAAKIQLSGCAYIIMICTNGCTSGVPRNGKSKLHGKKATVPHTDKKGSRCKRQLNPPPLI